MPLPLLLGILATGSGIGGLVAGAHGAKKMKDAKDTMQATQNCHSKNIEKFEEENKKTTIIMDDLGKLELEILGNFEVFSNVIEKIQNRPKFEEFSKEDVRIPRYDEEEIKKVSIGAGVLLGGIGGAALGTAGGFAAAGATTSAVMALGTASTGTAIASLSGAAATNATLAAIGGGAIGSGVGAGGMALGSTILGATTLGVALLVEGIIFNFTGDKLVEKADQAYNEMKKSEKLVTEICDYLKELKRIAKNYMFYLKDVKKQYDKRMEIVSYTVNNLNKTDWNEFTDEEKLILENLVLLVGLLYKMCQVKLVKKAEHDNQMNKINRMGVNTAIDDAKMVLREMKEES